MTKLWREHAEKIARDILADLRLGDASLITSLVAVIGQTVEIVEDDPDFEMEDGIVVKFSDWNYEDKWMVISRPVLMELINRIVVEVDSVGSMAGAWEWFVAEHLYPAGKSSSATARYLDVGVNEPYGTLEYDDPRGSLDELLKFLGETEGS